MGYTVMSCNTGAFDERPR